MPKRNRQKTEAERAQHDTAVRVRKMTDAQLCAFLDETYQRGKRDGAAAPPPPPQNDVAAFIQLLDAKSGTGNGIGKSTVYKLRKVAQSEGFLNGL